MHVYLAGGFKSGWQDTVMAACPGPTYLDPRAHGLADPTEYTEWDLRAVKTSDLVFAYLEATNPAGHNLAFEVGYAVAHGTPVLFVDEKAGRGGIPDTATSMLRAAATEWFYSAEPGKALETAIERLYNRTTEARLRYTERHNERALVLRFLKKRAAHCSDYGEGLLLQVAHEISEEEHVVCSSDLFRSITDDLAGKHD